MLIVLTKNSLSKVIFMLTVISVSEQQLELYITHHFAFPLLGSKFCESRCILVSVQYNAPVNLKNQTN